MSVDNLGQPQLQAPPVVPRGPPVVPQLPQINEIQNMDPVDSVFKSLRLLPEFDGNPNVLTRFIRLCDQLVLAHIKSEPGYELSNLALLNGILNKVTGPAARTINSNGIPENWQGIRNALINNFADQRDETALYNDLALLSQGSNSPQEYYERCQNLFSIIMTYVTLHEEVTTTIEAKRSLYKKLTLQAFIRGLKDPLGSRIRCMRPESIEKALEYVQEEVNVLYLQQRHEHPSALKWQPQSILLQNSRMQQHAQTAKPLGLGVPGPSRPMVMPYPGHQQWRPQTSNFQQNQGPTRTQQVFRAAPPGYNPQNGGFRIPRRDPPQGTQQNTPRPMSGVSHFSPRPLPPSGHDWRRHGNPPPSNYFRTRETNLNECSDYEYGPYYEYCPDYYYVEPEQYGDDTRYYTDSDQGTYYLQRTEIESPNALDSDSIVENNCNVQDFPTPSRSNKPK